MNITGFKVKPTSTKGHSLLESNEKRGVCAEISIQLPTDVAAEIVRRWDIVEKMEASIERLPVEWERIFNIEIIDPDGWKDKSFEDTITKKEFIERMNESTIIPLRA